MNNIEPEPINDLVLEDGKENENSAQTLHTCTCSKNYRLQIYSLQIYSLQITRSTDYSCYTYTDYSTITRGTEVLIRVPSRHVLYNPIYFLLF